MKTRVWVLFLLSVLLFSANIWGISISIVDEAKNSSCAREMLESGNFILPTFNYELRTDKPPLHYFAMSMAYWVFGVNEFAARFFSMVCGVLSIMTTFYFTKKLLDANTAFYASLILLSSLQWSVQFHLAVPDPYLILLTDISIFAFLLFQQEQKKYWLYLMYVAMGLGVLAKGPVAIILPLSACFFFLLFKGKMHWYAVRQLQPLQGLLVISMITLPWYLAVHFQTDGAWTEGFFLKHNFGRFTDKMEGHGGSVFQIPLFMILGLLPFSFFLPQALLFAFKSHAANNLIFHSLIVSTVYLLFFTLSQTKLPSYPAPAYPFIAIIIAYYFDKKIKDVGIALSGMKISFWLYFIAMLALPIGVYIGLENHAQLNSLRNLAWYFIILTLGALIAMICLYRRRITLFTYTLSASWITLLLCIYYLLLPQVDRFNPSVQVMQKLPENTVIVSYRRFNPAIAFYYKKKIEIEDNVDSLQYRLKQQSQYLISTKKYWNELCEISDNMEFWFEQAELFEPDTLVIIRSGRIP